MNFAFTSKQSLR